MDGWALGFFLLAAFLGGLASGIAGFAMGFVVSGIWLHIITPIQTTTLIVGYGLWTQGLAAIVVNAVALSLAGAVTAETVKLYLLGLPMLLAGLWSGFKLYGKLDDAAFRKVILLLLLVSGLALIVPISIFR